MVAVSYEVHNGLKGLGGGGGRGLVLPPDWELRCADLLGLAALFYKSRCQPSGMIQSSNAPSESESNMMALGIPFILF